MIRTFLSVVGITALLSSSCQQSSFETELQVIDSLEISVEAVQQKFKQYDADLMKEKATKAEQQLQFISKNWTEQDTLPRSTAAFLSDYKANRKALKFYAEQIKRTIAEADYTLEQLKKLRGDINQNAFTKEQIHQYLEDEKQAASVLVESDITLDEYYTKVILHHDDARVLVDSVILNMNKRGIR